MGDGYYQLPGGLLQSLLLSDPELDLSSFLPSFDLLLSLFLNTFKLKLHVYSEINHNGTA